MVFLDKGTKCIVVGLKRVAGCWVVGCDRWLGQLLAFGFGAGPGGPGLLCGAAGGSAGG